MGQNTIAIEVRYHMYRNTSSFTFHESTALTNHIIFRCCGVEHFRDWYGRIPKSCCQEIDGVSYKPCQDNPSLANVHGRGCFEIGSMFIRERAAIMGGSGISLSLFMIVGMIFSCLFFNMIGE